MINWDNFYVFAAVSICLWLIGAVFALRSSTRSKTAIGFTSGGIIVLAVFITGLWLFLQRPPLLTGASSSAYDGGNPFVELFLHGHSRTTDLYQMAVSLDSFFLGTARHSLCHYQSDETRDTRPVTNAGSAKHMVHSPCHRIYVLLLCIGLCFYNRIDRVVPP